jgi:hypothetical protein
LIKPIGGIAATVAIQGITIDNNLGGGLRVDGTGGSGAVNVAITDSLVSFNASNGFNAVSGPGNVTLDIARVIVRSNGSSGTESTGGTASVTVGSSLIRGNVVGVTAIGGARLLSYSNNQVTGNISNGSFTGGAGLQRGKFHPICELEREVSPPRAGGYHIRPGHFANFNAGMFELNP